MSVAFDRIASRAPLNKTAAAVTGGSNDHYEPNVNYGTFAHWKEPPPCIRHPRAETFVDHTGVRFGRFVVVGYLGKLNRKKKAVWLVRCVCGNYEARHPTSFVAETASQDCCRDCLHWTTTKRRYERRGARPLTDFLPRPTTPGDAP